MKERAGRRGRGAAALLVLIGIADILPRLFGEVLLPIEVRDELLEAKTPELVRKWVASPPAWIELASAESQRAGMVSRRRGAGEQAAIELALNRGAELVLMDDRRGRGSAARVGLKTVGTIGLIDRAALLGLIDVASAVERLRRTNFRHPPEMLDALLAHGAKRL